MKRILVITPFFYPHVGGSQQYMEELYAEVLKINKDINVDVLCYNTDKTRKEEEYKGVHIYRLSCWNVLPGQFALPSPFELVHFFSKHGKSYDIIHCSTRFFDSSWWGVLYAKFAGKKIILTDHTAATPVHKNPFIYAVTWLIDRVTGTLFLSLYDKIFVVSKATQQFLKKTFHVSSTVIYAGVDREIFKPEKKSERQRLKILYIGRMIESKGVTDFFEVAKKITEADFIFVGPGPLVSTLRKEIDSSGIKHIKVIGRLEREATAKTFADADIFVNPSHHSEGIPMTLFQAGACGLTVVTTDQGGTSEIVHDKETGLLIQPGKEMLEQAINKLLHDQSLREKLAENLYKEVTTKFTWKASAEALSKELELE